MSQLQFAYVNLTAKLNYFSFCCQIFLTRNVELLWQESEKSPNCSQKCHCSAVKRVSNLKKNIAIINMKDFKAKVSFARFLSGSQNILGQFKFFLECYFPLLIFGNAVYRLYYMFYLVDSFESHA